MTIIINTCYGGFSLPEDFCKTYNMRRYEDIERTDERLVNYVRERGGVVKCNCAELRLVELPDNMTDYEITEYDGYERVICVVNGKLVHLCD